MARGGNRRKVNQRQPQGADSDHDKQEDAVLDEGEQGADGEGAAAPASAAPSPSAEENAEPKNYREHMASWESKKEKEEHAKAEASAPKKSNPVESVDNIPGKYLKFQK